MAAVSKAQAKLFRVAKAVKNRELNPHDASQRAIDIARTVQSYKIDNYAETDDTHLPERVSPKMKENTQLTERGNNGTDIKKGDYVRYQHDKKDGVLDHDYLGYFIDDGYDWIELRVTKVFDSFGIAKKENVNKIIKVPYDNKTWIIKVDADKTRSGLNEYDQYALSANGQVTMGTKGDALFLGSDAKMKGGTKRSVYKVPKSSIHYKNNNKKDLPPEFDDDDQKGKGKISYIADKSVPKNSIHDEKFGMKNEGSQDGSGANSMGTVGDGSFIGKSGIRMGGNSRKPVYKTPKSSVHYKKGKFPDDSDFYDEDNWETEKSRPSPRIAGKTTYIADRSVPTNSIHRGDKPDEDRNNTQTMEQFGIPMSADGVIDGGPKSMDPIVGKKTKKKKFADASKYGYPKFEKLKESLYTAQYFRDLTQKKVKERFSNLSENEFNKRYDELVDILVKEQQAEQEKYFNEEKDYDTNIVPKSSIHYGERDKVKGEPKMKFEKVVKAGFVPDEIKNLKTQGDWKSNLTKAVMDLTDEAAPKEQSLPVPIEPMGDTPEFPFAKEDGSMVYPIPGMGIAIKSNNTWTFGDTPPLPASQKSGEDCSLGHGELSANMIDIPCSKKPLIKKLMMFIKKEQSNLYEGIELKGEYNGKIVKLNTIYEGVERRFKTYIKNKDRILEIHFGPKKNESCGGQKVVKEENIITNSQKILNLYNKNKDGFYLVYTSNNKWIMYSTNDKDLYNYLEKKLGEWSNANAEKWSEYEVIEIYRGQEDTFSW